MEDNIRQNKTKTMRRVGLFYIFTNLFKVQLNTKTADFHICFCVLCNVISHSLQPLESTLMRE